WLRAPRPSPSDHSFVLKFADLLGIHSQFAEDGLRILPDRGDRVHAACHPGHLDRGRKHGDRPGGCVDVVPAAAFGQLRVVGDLAHVSLPRVGDLCGLEQLSHCSPVSVAKAAPMISSSSSLWTNRWAARSKRSSVTMSGRSRTWVAKRSHSRSFWIASMIWVPSTQVKAP